MSETYRIKGMDLLKEDLLSLEEDVLRALMRERTHHTIEIFLYTTLKGLRKPPKDFGMEVRILFDIWEERMLPTDAPDIQWIKHHLDIAQELSSGKIPQLDTALPEPYDEKAREVVDDLLFNRRSIRQWKDKKVPPELIRKVIDAGLAAPNACNLQCQRFIVLDDPKSMAIIKADVPIPPLKIVIGQDMRIYKWIGLSERSPQNIYFDAAAAADHMLLMAHALGLGGVWLTHSPVQAEKLRAHLGLPDYLRMDTHIALGWPDESPLKSARLRAEDATILQEVNLAGSSFFV